MFLAQGLLPPNIVFQETEQYPTPDFEFLSGGTGGVERSAYKLVTAASNFLYGFTLDAGAGKDEALIVFGGVHGQGSGIFVSDAIPSGNEVPDNSYLFTWSPSVSQFAIYKRVGGGFTALDQYVIGPNSAPSGYNSISMAIYRKNSTGKLICFASLCGEEFWPIFELTNSDVGLVKSAGFRGYSDGAYTHHTAIPFVARTS